jgi:YbbR domain-containing protein
MAWHPFRNVGLKMAALALGTLLWYTVAGHQIDRRLAVPLSYSNLPSPLEMTGERIDTVSVQVRGVDNLVSGLREGDLRAVVDLHDVHAGANIIPLRVDEVVAPPGVEVLLLDPGTVTVTLERTTQVDVPVRPTIDGQPPRGYEVGEIRVEPATVTVAGPEGRLKNEVTAITERILIDGQTSQIVRDVGVGIVDAQLRVLRPRSVRVTIPITRRTH